MPGGKQTYTSTIGAFLPATRRAGSARWRNPLLQWIRSHGVTQKQLGVRLGYSPRGSMMSQLVNGRREFSAKQLRKCASVTGISEHDLLAIYKHAAHYKKRPGPRHRRTT